MPGGEPKDVGRSLKYIHTSSADSSLEQKSSHPFFWKEWQRRSKSPIQWLLIKRSFLNVEYEACSNAQVHSFRMSDNTEVILAYAAFGLLWPIAAIPVFVMKRPLSERFVISWYLFHLRFLCRLSNIGISFLRWRMWFSMDYLHMWMCLRYWWTTPCILFILFPSRDRWLNRIDWSVLYGKSMVVFHSHFEVLGNAQV